MKSSQASDQSLLWNASQREALAALNLPVWHAHKASVSEVEATTQESFFYYKLGAWLLVLDERLPVAVPLWLSDVFFACTQEAGAKPVEVSASAADNWSQDHNLQLSLTSPSASEKRALWLKLSGVHVASR